MPFYDTSKQIIKLDDNTCDRFSYYYSQKQYNCQPTIRIFVLSHRTIWIHSNEDLMPWFQSNFVS